MNFFTKAAAGIVSILLLGACVSGSGMGKAAEGSAAAFVRSMGIGVNIGNTFDSFYDNVPNPAGESGWGNPKITREFIEALKKNGYRTIRLPVSWMEHLGPAPNYPIENEWMDRVAQVVGWILDEDMYCILNLHHDGGNGVKPWIRNADKDREGVTQQFIAVWTQIANHFAETDNRLIFEAMNEVGFERLYYQWDSGRNKKAEAFGLVNHLNQTFVDTVRNTGSNNPLRYLLVSGYDTDIDQTCDPLFKMPTDTVTDKLILSIHYYTPPTFCLVEDPNNSWGFKSDWGSEADETELAGQLDKLYERFIRKGIPVIMGEYAVFKKNKVEIARVRWLRSVTQSCLNIGICPVLWDTGNEIKRRAPYEMSDTLKSAMKSVKRR
jgi:endoglucanase